ncbi:hypothetical protein TVAG_314650 [Trichomonas vaginalis G3]|uniref:Uncharacterized protein n=1 Tax=Trichomonas vaginalis (strain ATCC PRA-98 / G3) TaxID=412133 RepID=A2ETQ4_TRIV3|nr:hypothetical protein TVAGG3_0046170 [Trichomonas vaginalis G3]EAY03935.1 hypothetical protein TVAG_314650 [Trichomonas vaginalis G3]KAI5541045.1 hypothetical protein TVAGG3_0046170 [Trichomonas vaginalis G3]|eukprot:XP_001316158.1 hypothetical protein [Trichomonas vaginalis G3]
MSESIILSPQFKSQFSVQSKRTPKKSPSFARQKGEINFDNYNINPQLEKQDAEDSQDEPPENENQPNIENKEEVSEDHQVYGVFVNEENDHKRNRPLRELSDSDGLINSDYSDEYGFNSSFSFGEVKTVDNKQSDTNEFADVSEVSTFSTLDSPFTNSDKSNFFTPHKYNETSYIGKFNPNKKNQIKVTPTRKLNSTFLQSPNRRNDYQIEDAQTPMSRRNFRYNKYLNEDDDDWMVIPQKYKEEQPDIIYNDFPEKDQVVGPKYIEKNNKVVFFDPPKHKQPKLSPKKKSKFSTPRK